MPSGHSSSSHSSHSSSSHSSSHSSSFGSSRSYSSSSSSRGPSSHSSSSWSSRPSSSSSYGKSGSRPASKPAIPAQPMRPRVNQPMGYRPFGGMSPRYVYGRRHDYVYYPVAWVDSSTGRSYEKGYYDENGQHYDDVSFNQDGKYKNVVCHCNYCDTDTIVDLAAEDAAGKTLQCPACGAPMVVNSFLDDYVTTGSSGTDNRSNASDDTAAVRRTNRRRIGCLVALAIFLAIGVISCVATEMGGSSPSYSTTTQQVYTLNESNTDIFGETVFLSANGAGGYNITEGSGTADKVMVWSVEDDSYYDESSECWVWYNTDMDPPVWQYWYEGISSDYGDYGWMEHDEDGWYIEASHGNWIDLPEKYDTGRLWYIDN